MSQQAVIEEQLNEVAGHLNAQHARLVTLTVALIADESAWASDSLWTVEQYLCWRVGISPERARQVADVARRADAFPECMTAFERGELTLDQVSAIVRKAPSWTDAEITELAKVMTVRQLQYVVGKYSFPQIPGRARSRAMPSTARPTSAGPADASATMRPPQRGATGSETDGHSCCDGTDRTGRSVLLPFRRRRQVPPPSGDRSPDGHDHRQLPHRSTLTPSSNPANTTSIGSTRFARSPSGRSMPSPPPSAAIDGGSTSTSLRPAGASTHTASACPTRSVGTSPATVCCHPCSPTTGTPSRSVDPSTSFPTAHDGWSNSATVDAGYPGAPHATSSRCITSSTGKTTDRRTRGI